MEINFDGLVGPTHHYGGLGIGNTASAHNKGLVSHPKASALQGLAKMKIMLEAGIPQGFLPPQLRPQLTAMRQLTGFQGTDSELLKNTLQNHPKKFSACCSSSSMWAANSATFSPSEDSADGKFHITPANLTSQLHRGLEGEQSLKILRNIFLGDRFVHHNPLAVAAKDEGAANHMRMFGDASAPGLQIFVYK